MDASYGLHEPVGGETPTWSPPKANGVSHHPPSRPHGLPSAEVLRRCAWEIGERRAGDAFTPSANHVGLAAVLPARGFAHWRIQPEWVEQTARDKGDAWHHCRMVLRLYDVSYVEFNGLNAHHLQDQPLPSLCGHLFFALPRPGTWQLAEVGFVLRNGEFLAAARSRVVRFPPDAPCPRGGAEALLVTERGRIEAVGNVWEHETVLRERLRPRLRKPLRIATLALGSSHTGQEGTAATFAAELAAGQCAEGHEVHAFVPAAGDLTEPREVAGVRYHPLDLPADGTPLEKAIAFAEVVGKRLQELPPFDLFHCHEWMTALAPWLGSRPTVLSLHSVEATRRNGTPPTDLSREIEEVEREAARSAGCVLIPDWLRDKALGELGLDETRLRSFAMEGRLANEWECPLDLGAAKREIGVGPMDRLVLFVGPLEHAAGVDLLLEALPTLLNRWPNLRLAYVGAGNMYGALQHRAGPLGVAHAVRLLGHMEGPLLTRMLRAAAAVVLPSRYRVPFDDAVVDLARRAGRPVITTHAGPAHLVRHEENGLLTYDNPGSMVWAVDRVLGDPAHADGMGASGRRADGAAPRWCEVTRQYLELCATLFPELAEEI
jgi:glycosyltransferase involved in cell wall biosynthesis